MTWVHSKRKPLLIEDSYAGTSVITRSPNTVIFLRELKIDLLLQRHDSYTFFCRKLQLLDVQLPG